jgi:beta-lactamase regulating signal transducer with metallopeptidase domain
MGSIQHLTGLGLVASGFLRILAAYVLFIALTRLTSRSYVRHALWLLFLIGTGVYWATLAAQVLPLTFTHVTTRREIVGAPAASSATTSVTIPFAWDNRIELASGIVVWAYVGGLIIMLFRLAGRRRCLRKVVARAQRVSPDIQVIFDTECHRLGVSKCQILELPGLRSPGTAYIWRSLVLVPERLDLYLDSEQFVDVLYHELIHVRRLDFLWGTLGEVVGCLLFFHPAVWLALRNLGRERELACDEAVMELRRGRRTDYALCLTRLARRRVLGYQLDPPSHLALLNSFLALRVQTLLAESRRRSRGKQSAAISAGLFALFVFFAGWSSLSLAFELARPLGAGAPLVVQGGHSRTSQKIRAGRGKPHALSTEIKLPRPIPTEPHRIPSEADEIASLPADGGNLDALIASPQVESGALRREVEQGPTWDEAPRSTPVQSPVSWRRTVMGAAIGALERVAVGSKEGDKDPKER